jgi:hypothetical protein
MVDVRVSHPRFQQRILSVRSSGLMGPKLLLDGQLLQRHKGAYSVADDAGVTAAVKLKAFLDPIPKVEIDGIVHEIARKLAWYEYAWAAWTLLLVPFGGALGGAFGAGATLANIHVMRTDLSVAARFAITLLISVVAVGAFFLAATMIHVLTNR